MDMKKSAIISFYCCILLVLLQEKLRNGHEKECYHFLLLLYLLVLLQEKLRNGHEKRVL